ncbi:hypothetical protein U1Q18_046096 [Sarracenia purpurea var. burkii]
MKSIISTHVAAPVNKRCKQHVLIDNSGIWMYANQHPPKRRRTAQRLPSKESHLHRPLPLSPFFLDPTLDFVTSGFPLIAATPIVSWHDATTIVVSCPLLSVLLLAFPQVIAVIVVASFPSSATLLLVLEDRYFFAISLLATTLGLVYG